MKHDQIDEDFFFAGDFVLAETCPLIQHTVQFRPTVEFDPQCPVTFCDRKQIAHAPHFGFRTQRGRSK
jgi:hypothetical protein